MQIFQKLIKFASVGLLITLVSLTSSVSLLKFGHTPLIPTYLAVYLSTILLSYYLNSKYTFSSNFSTKKTTIYFVIYLSCMFIGANLLHLVSKLIILENWIYPFCILPITATYNFILTNKFLKNDKLVIP